MHLFQTVLLPKKDQNIFQSRVVPPRINHGEATFDITYSGKFLPMQLIYKGKTQRSFPRVNSLTSFSLSANSKHFSNTHESLKLLDEIIILYVEKKKRSTQSRQESTSTFGHQCIFRSSYKTGY